jgi:hypothetical protein
MPSEESSSTTITLSPSPMVEVGRRLMLKTLRHALKRSLIEIDLVTGGIGFVGTNLSDRWSRDGHEIVLFDNVSRAGVQLNLDWLKGQVPLGINYSQMHDSSGRVVRDGELLFAVAEERISRAKHDARFPRNAIQACLKFVKVRAEQLDEVCLGWQTAGGRSSGTI